MPKGITIEFKDGTRREFLDPPPRSWPFESVTNRLRLEKGLAIITDEHGDNIIIPMANIKEIKKHGNDTR